MRNFIANAASKSLQLVGKQAGYRSSPSRNELNHSNAVLNYIDHGLMHSDGKTVTRESLKNKDIANKVKLLSLLPDNMIRLMTLNQTRIEQFSYTIEPSTAGALPVQTSFGWWNSEENRITVYESADQILGLGAKWFVPLLHSAPKMKVIPEVFAVYHRYGFNMSDVAFTHEAGHMLHLQDVTHNTRRPFWERVDDTPFDAITEAQDRLARFADSKGLTELKREFESKFPGNKNWKKVREVARAFRFALDIDSDYLKQAYPTLDWIRNEEPARRSAQIAETIATAYALKQTLFRDQPELLQFMLPKLSAYIGVLERRVDDALRARECEAIVDPNTVHDTHQAQVANDQPLARQL